MKHEHLQKQNDRTMRACFATALDTQMKHGGVKAKCFRGVKMTADAKIFVWNFL